MRISDWSSDVCSSDLGCSPTHRRNSRRSSMLACCHQAFINATQSRGGDVSSTCASCDAADAVADGADGNSVGGIAACARSEEHTSELQSLMRISYAVFCLKQKNPNTINQHSTKYNTTNHTHAS